jgi:hypothetical protein
MNTFEAVAHWDNQGERGMVRHTLTGKHPARHYAGGNWIGRGLLADGGGLVAHGYASEAGAQQAVNRWARVIQFIDATGAKPSRAWRSVFKGPYGSRLVYPPDMDHTLVWRVAGRLLVTTEPYHERPELAAWCGRNGWACAPVQHFGMWFPEGDTRLYLLAPPKGGADVGKVAQALEGVTPWTP